jgi:endoglucanase
MPLTSQNTNLKKEFKAALGQNALIDFEKSFRDTFIKEGDFKRIAKLGLNCLRVPFNYRLIVRENFKFDKNGIKYLDKVVKWAKKYKLWIIWDLHAAPGAQNHDWHSDSCGKAGLWTDKKNQHRTIKIWEFLADRYKNEEIVAGYDLINESVVRNTRLLNKFYKQLIKAIRRIDKNHILFIEGNYWATDINCLDKFDDDNYVISIHDYEPIDFVFNFVPGQKFPLKHWKMDTNRKHLNKYKKISKERNRPIFVGEFGVNYRNNLEGEIIWLKDLFKCFNQNKFSWTYWTYKSIKNYMFPDGIISYYENPLWVNRQGPVTGWDTYKGLWKKNKREIIESFKSKNYRENKLVIKAIKDAV